MATDLLKMSSIRNLNIPHAPPVPDIYFHSKIFISPHHPNPLVAAISPLLSILERLCVSPTLPLIESLHANIQHELNAFQSLLYANHCPTEFHALAYYLVTVTIDEIIGKNYIRVYGAPVAFRAFTPLSHSDIGPEKRFFEIVQYIKMHPSQYLDLVELAYYCLICGFEGEQRLKPDGRATLDNLIEELHGLIQQHRVFKTHRLFKEPPPPKAQKINLIPVWVMVIAGFTLITASIFFSFSVIDKKAKSVLFGHAVLAKMDN